MEIAIRKADPAGQKDRRQENIQSRDKNHGNHRRAERLQYPLQNAQITVAGIKKGSPVTKIQEGRITPTVAARTPGIPAT